MNSAEVTVALAELHADIDQRRLGRSRLVRRVTNCAIIALSEDPDADQKELRLRTREVYRQKFPKGLVVSSLLVSILINVISSILASLILRWWHKRHPDENEDSQELALFVAALGNAASQELEQDCETDAEDDDG